MSTSPRSVGIPLTPLLVLSRRLARVRARPLTWCGVLLVVLLLAPLAACSSGAGGSGDSSAGSGSGADAGAASDTDAGGGSEIADESRDAATLSEQEEGAGAGAEAGAEGGADDASGARARVEPMQRAVISTGQVELRSRDVARDRAEVLRLVTGWRGLVADEESGTDDDGRTSFSSLTLRVPSARFDDAMTALADVATVVQQGRSSEDVTTQVVDVDARVRAQERSVRRIEALLAEADSLRDVIAIESDLARRQADLESLVAQQTALADQTSLSTITVSIEAEDLTPPQQDEDRGGFLGGLEAGWAGLGASAAVVLTVAGAVLPFAVLAAVVGVPLWVVVRRRRARSAPGAAA